MTSYQIVGSEDSHSSRLGLFYLPATDVGLQSFQYLDFTPTSKSEDGQVLEFIVNNTSSGYIDLRNTRLWVKCKLVQGDGSDIPLPTYENIEGSDEPKQIIKDVSRVSIANLFGACLFKQVDVSLQQTAISNYIGSNYPYKAYFDVMFFSTAEQRKGEYTSMFYDKEDYEYIEGLDPYTTSNRALFNRHQYVKGSKEFDMSTKIFHDLFDVDRYLLNNVPICLKFYKNSPEFCLVSSNTDVGVRYKVKIMEASLRVPFVYPTASLLIAQSKVLKEHDALYPYQGSVMKTYTLAKGERSGTFSNIFNEDIPTYLIVSMINSQSYVGKYTTNPLAFYAYECNYISFSIDGQSVPHTPAHPHFVTDKYEDSMVSQTYSTLFSGDLCPNISREEFSEGHTMFLFQIMKTKKGCLTPQKRGNTKLEIRFAKELPHPVTILVYGKFPAQFRIDSTRNVLFS